MWGVYMVSVVGLEGMFIALESCEIFDVPKPNQNWCDEPWATAVICVYVSGSGLDHRLIGRVLHGPSTLGARPSPFVAGQNAGVSHIVAVQRSQKPQPAKFRSSPQHGRKLRPYGLWRPGYVSWWPQTVIHEIGVGELVAASEGQETYLVSHSRGPVAQGELRGNTHFFRKIANGLIFFRKRASNIYFLLELLGKQILTVRASVSSNRVANRPPCMIPSWPHIPLPRCKNTMLSDSSCFALIKGSNASFPGPLRAPAVRLFTLLSSGKFWYGRVSYQSFASSVSLSALSNGRVWSFSSKLCVYAWDSGESGSAGGPGAARGKRMFNGGGGYMAPSVPATTEATATAMKVPRCRLWRGSGGAVESNRTWGASTFRRSILSVFVDILAALSDYYQFREYL